MTALARIYDRATVDAALRRHLVVDRFDPLLEIDTGRDLPCVSGRIDGFVADDGDYRFLEYNIEPGGIAPTDRLAEVFGATPLMQRLGRRFRLSSPVIAEHYLQALLRAVGARAASGPPRVGIVGRSENLAPEEQDLAAYGRSQGLEIELVTRAELEFRRGELLAHGRAVQVVVLSDQESGAVEIAAGSPLAEALRARAVFVLSGLHRPLVFRAKSTFAVLTDPRHAGIIGGDLLRTVSAVIPWTRVVRDDRTERAGRSIDLLPYIAEHREQLVLKPIFGLGGIGVVLGRTCTQDAWLAHLTRALVEPTIVQEHVTAPTGTFPVLDQGRMVFDTRHWDYNPFSWNEDGMAGSLGRVSGNPVINLMIGGSLMPVFEVDDG